MASGNPRHATSTATQTNSGNTGAPALQPRLRVPEAYAEALAEYAGSLDRTPLASASRAKYLGRARGYLSWLASAEVQGDPLDDAVARDWAVGDYRRWLKVARKAAPSTINNTLAALDDFYTRRGLGPAAARREDPQARTAPRALDPQQASRFLRAVEQEPSLRNRLMALLPYYAGLRTGEVVGLDIGDVALSARKGEIRVMGKGRDSGKLRTVPVHGELRPVLQAWLIQRRGLPGGETTPALLVNARGGRISDRYAREVIDSLGRVAGLDAERLEPFGPHALRHTFGTQLVRGGVDLVTVAELMGHARLDTTRIYTLPTKADREHALEALLTDR